MTVSMIKKGFCECGREYRIFQPEAREMADLWKKSAAGVWDVTILVAEGSSAKCSGCGSLIFIPPAEDLDPERSEPGRFLLDIEEGSQDEETL